MLSIPDRPSTVHGKLEHVTTVGVGMPLGIPQPEHKNICGTSGMPCTTHGALHVTVLWVNAMAGYSKSATLRTRPRIFFLLIALPYSDAALTGGHVCWESYRRRSTGRTLTEQLTTVAGRCGTAGAGKRLGILTAAGTAGVYAKGLGSAAAVAIIS
jgi:hypothetical protein